MKRFEQKLKGDVDFLLVIVVGLVLFIVLCGLCWATSVIVKAEEPLEVRLFFPLISNPSSPNQTATPTPHEPKHTPTPHQPRRD